MAHGSLHGGPNRTSEWINLCVLCIPRAALGIDIILNPFAHLLFILGLDHHEAAHHIRGFAFRRLFGQQSPTKDDLARLDAGCDVGQMLRANGKPLVERAREIWDVD